MSVLPPTRAGDCQPRTHRLHQIQRGDVMARNILLTLSLLAATSVCQAQENTNKEQPHPADSQPSAQTPIRRTIIFVKGQPLLEGVQTITLPQEKGAWAIQLIRHGGILGGVRSTWLISSQGEVVKNDGGTPLSAKLTPDVLSKLTQLVTSAKFNVRDEPTVSPCRDCYTSTLILYRREADGIERTYIISWDESTVKKLPQEIVDIYAAIIDVKETSLNEGPNQP